MAGRKKRVAVNGNENVHITRLEGKGKSLNSSNKLDNKKKAAVTMPGPHRQALERKLGCTFSSPDLLWKALQAAGNGVMQIGDKKIEEVNQEASFGWG
jgi:hypothetical protein